MIFHSWDERKAFLVNLQDRLTEKFGTERYNVFVFGSFVTDLYVPGKSDLDLAVYAESAKFARMVYNFLDDYLQELDVERSIIIIDTEQKYAFISLDALQMRIGFTDYFPEDLEIYELQLMRRFIWYNEEKNMLQKKFPVHW